MDLKEARTAVQQTERVCTALGIDHVSGDCRASVRDHPRSNLWRLRHLCTQNNAAVARAAAKLGGLPSSRRVLLLLDNADGCLQGQNAVSFGQLLEKVRALSTAMR